MSGGCRTLPGTAPSSTIPAGTIPTPVALHSRLAASRAGLPIVQGRRWCRFLDTARPSAEDIVEAARRVPIEGDRVRVEAGACYSSCRIELH